MPSADERLALGEVMLGRALLDRGHAQAAKMHFERACELLPGDRTLDRWLAYVAVHEERFDTAVSLLKRAVSDTPDNSQLVAELALLSAIAGHPNDESQLADQPDGRLKFGSRYTRTHHRSGWKYAMSALESLHSTEGVLFDGFLEDTFAWQQPREGRRPGPELLRALRNPSYEGRITAEERCLLPYRERWVGFFHNPQNMPGGFHSEESPQSIKGKRVCHERARHCVGLFALSEYHAQWLRSATKLPVSVVHHPTEIPQQLFSMDAFESNLAPKVVQIGWWLRRQTAIDHLPLPQSNAAGLTKLRLVPKFFENSGHYIEELREAEFLELGQVEEGFAANTRHLSHIPNPDYDELLAANIAFVELLDASANNVVIECLARTTPLLVNRHPAVVEYLGDDYPLYYRDLSQAATFAQDMGRLAAAHDSLRTNPLRDRLGAQAFRKAVLDSEVYALL